MLGNIWNFLIYGPIHNLLTYLYVITGSLGLSTFILIIVIRIVLWPMVAKQYRDTKKIRSIQPRLDELKEKYKNDPTGMAQAQQAVYKEINYNPLGCFTNFLIQIPVLIALYQSVLAFTKSGVTPQNMPGLYPFVEQILKGTGQSSFATDLFGIQLLLSPGSIFSNGLFASPAIPYLILLLILGLSNMLPTLVSMKLMNTQVPKVKKNEAKTDAETMQEAFSSSLNTSTLYVMPVMLTLSMTPLPSIVSVYMIAQNIISTVQQLLVKYLHDKKLSKKLVTVLKNKYSYSNADAEPTAAKLLRLSQSINFLADELGEFDHIKTLSVKIHDIPFEKVLKKIKDPAKALLLFDRMAKTPEKAEEILSQA
ncbi:MAG: YidC/Oxa1 family membrane protein insertase [Patescibacteria group bacterium]